MADSTQSDPPLNDYWLSAAWEAATGADSIKTIERVYTKRPSGAYECIWPDCEVARKDSTAMWRHVHTAHTGASGLPSADWDPGPWMADVDES